MNLRTLILIASLLFFTICASAEQPRIKVGLSTPITGDAATYGQDLKNFLEFAIDKYGAGKYELVIEDDRCDGKLSTSAAQKFVNIDKVQVAFGSPCSGAALPAAAVYERAKVLNMITVASAERIAEAGDFIFRSAPADGGAGSLLRSYIEQHLKTVAIISEETEYAQGMKKGIVEPPSQELKFIEEDYLPGTQDFRSILLRLKAAKPEGLVINSQSEAGFALILKVRRELEWNVPVFGTYWPGTPALLSIAKDDLEGTIFADTPALDQFVNPEGLKLYEEFKAKYGPAKSVELYFASTIEGFRSIHAALNSNTTSHDGTDLRHFLYTQKFNGIFGPYYYDKNGEIVGPQFVLKRIENGAPKPLR